MAFQTEVLPRIQQGLPGEIAYDAPTRVRAGVAAASGEYGQLFWIAQDTADLHPTTPEVTPVYAPGLAPYGILINPKEGVLAGSDLAPNYSIPQGSVGSFLTEGLVYILVTGDFAVEPNETNGRLVWDSGRFEFVTGPVPSGAVDVSDFIRVQPGYGPVGGSPTELWLAVAHVFIR